MGGGRRTRRARSPTRRRRSCARTAIHVALLIVDATIDSPKTARFIAGRPENETADMAEIARAVEYLANQSPRAYTHELVVTPAGDRWVP